MRRAVIVVFATLVTTPILLMLPVAADPGPAPEPVAATVEEIPLGTVAAPAEGAEVQPGTTEPVPGAETIPTLTVSRADTDEFSAVGVTWTIDVGIADVVLKIRTKDSTGGWSEWAELEQDEIAAMANPEAARDGRLRGGTEPVWTGPRIGVEVEVVTLSGVAPRDIELVLINPGHAPADAAPSEPGVQDLANAGASMPPIYSRAQWGADESIRTWDPEYASTIKAATIHHTADSNDYTADEVPSILRSIYQYHAVSRGWGDIGYNVIVDAYGRIWEGRYGGLSSAVIGAHAGGFNTFTFGVSMLGNYDVVEPREALIASVAQVIAWKLSLYGVNPYGTSTLISGGGGTATYPEGTPVQVPNIFGHRDVGSTTCPGRYGYARLDDIRARVSAQMAPMLTDISPSSVAGVLSRSGHTTVVVRGTDARLYTQTSVTTGGWSGYTPIPMGIATGSPAAVSADGTRIDVVVRGTDGAMWQNWAAFDAQGRPSGWRGWVSMGGEFTSAPGVASTGANRLGVVGRGTDGAMWQMNWTGTRWSGWTNLGGRLVSAPAVEARNGSYLVTAVGLDNRFWQMYADAGQAGGTSGWFGGTIQTGRTPQTDAAGYLAFPGASRLSTGEINNRVRLFDPVTGTSADLGGAITSAAAIVRQGDGSIWVLGRGADDQLWLTVYDPRSGQQSPWYAAGGELF